MASSSTKFVGSGEVKLLKEPAALTMAEIQCTARGMNAAQVDLNTWLWQIGPREKYDEFLELVSKRLRDISLALDTPQLEEMKKRAFLIKWGGSGSEDATEQAAYEQEIIKQGLPMITLWSNIREGPIGIYLTIEDLIPEIYREPDFLYRTLLSLTPLEGAHYLHETYCVNQ